MANQDDALLFVEEAVALTQQLAHVIGKSDSYDRTGLIRTGKHAYEDLLQRRASLVLSPKISLGYRFASGQHPRASAIPD